MVITISGTILRNMIYLFKNKKISFITRVYYVTNAHVGNGNGLF